MSDASQLYVLQASDTRITQLQSQIREVEAALRGDSELDRSRVVAAAATATRHSSEAVAQAAEAEMAALDARIRSLDRRLYDGSVRNPQELLEMQHELETLRGRARDAEDRAIALLQETESAADSERATVRTLEEHEQRRSGALEPLRRRLEALTADLERETTERESIAAGIEARNLALYARVAQRRQPAVVGLSGDTCGGCHLPVSNEERRAVRAGERIVQCANCDRILVP